MPSRSHTEHAEKLQAIYDRHIQQLQKGALKEMEQAVLTLLTQGQVVVLETPCPDKTNPEFTVRQIIDYHQLT